MFGEIFWDVVPYVSLAIAVVGTWWRYRYDKFDWTTRSSQLYESRRRGLRRVGELASPVAEPVTTRRTGVAGPGTGTR